MKVDGFDQQAFAHALSRLGLERLVPLLDQTQRWDRELSLDEQLGLAFARILLLAPRWLLMDDAFGSLEDEAVERVIDVFNKELAHTSIIHIGRAAQARDPIFTHVLHLVPKASVKGSLKQSTGAHS
jgi:putative ATP-binding cassette transporter